MYISLIYEGVLLRKILTSVDVGVGRKYLEGVQTHRQPVFSPLLLCLSPVPIRSLRQFFFFFLLSNVWNRRAGWAGIACCGRRCFTAFFFLYFRHFCFQIYCLSLCNTNFIISTFRLATWAQENSKQYVFKQTWRPNRYPNTILGKHRSKLIETETKVPENTTIE